MAKRELLYTEVASRRATLADRARMLQMLWAISAEPDLTARQRRRTRRLALRHYVFSWRPLVSWYVFSR